MKAKNRYLFLIAGLAVSLPTFSFSDISSKDSSSAGMELGLGQGERGAESDQRSFISASSMDSLSGEDPSETIRLGEDGASSGFSVNSTLEQSADPRPALVDALITSSPSSFGKNGSVELDGLIEGIQEGADEKKGELLSMPATVGVMVALGAGVICIRRIFLY